MLSIPQSGTAELCLVSAAVIAVGVAVPAKEAAEQRLQKTYPCGDSSWMPARLGIDGCPVKRAYQQSVKETSSALVAESLVIEALLAYMTLSAETCK